MRIWLEYEGDTDDHGVDDAGENDDGVVLLMVMMIMIAEVTIKHIFNQKRKVNQLMETTAFRHISARI